MLESNGEIVLVSLILDGDFITSEGSGERSDACLVFLMGSISVVAHQDEMTEVIVLGQILQLEMTNDDFEQLGRNLHRERAGNVSGVVQDLGTESVRLADGQAQSLQAAKVLHSVDVDDG